MDVISITIINIWIPDKARDDIGKGFMLKELFRQLGLPENAQRVYLRLVENGESTARLLAENLNIPRPSVYDNLKILIKEGLVVERDEENKKIFQIDDPQKLSQIIDLRIERLNKQNQTVKEILPELNKHMSAVEPKIKFYSGVEGIKQVYRDLLWYDDIKTYAMWPISEMIEVLGADYIADFTKKKVRNKIWSYVIWPEDKLIDFKEYKFLSSGWEYLRNIRIAPKGMTWNMSYWLYADKVAFVSSRQETFGFVVHSRDFAELILAQFKEIWKISKNISKVKTIPKAF